MSLLVLLRLLRLLLSFPTSSEAATRALVRGEDEETLRRVVAWRSSLFRGNNERAVNRLVVLRLHAGRASEALEELLRRRIEETPIAKGRSRVDSHSLSVLNGEVESCGAAAAGAATVLWPCSLAQFSSLQPFSPRVAFAIMINDPLEAAVARFYNAHATDHMKRQVPIAKYFRHQTSGAFSDEHLQHIRAYVAGGREFLKSTLKLSKYHDLGKSQLRQVANDPHKGTVGGEEFQPYFLVVRSKARTSSFYIHLTVTK
jgi:hypothetical protein